MMCTQSRPCWILMGVGAALLVLVALSFPVLHHIIHQKVHQAVGLQPGSNTYDMFVEPTIPIYLEVYVFDLKNPLDILAGEKPYVEQKGPYVYREHRKKFAIVHNHNDTITYKQNKTYVFEREKSVGSDGDLFTTINMPLVTFTEYLHWHGGSVLDPLVSLLFRLLSEDVFVTRSVRDIVWGYQDEMLKAGKLLDPSRFYTDIVGVLAGKNHTDDGTYTIHSGVVNMDRLGTISLYNGSQSLNFWTSASANMINGTDGSLAPPFISKDLQAFMFSTDICRSVYGIYAGTVTSEHGLPVWRFRAPVEILQSADKNPDNAGFCTPQGNCMKSGVLNISTCQTLDGFHLPVVASFPHFHLADRSFQDAILGLDPDQDDLTVDLDIEPVSGIVMHIAKRLQINMFIRGDSNLSQFKSMQTMVYPILWVNETATIDASHSDQVYKQLLLPVFIAQILQYALLANGALAIMIAALALIRIHGQRCKSRLLVNDESTDQIIPEEGDGKIEEETDTLEEAAQTEEDNALEEEGTLNDRDEDRTLLASTNGQLTQPGTQLA